MDLVKRERDKLCLSHRAISHLARPGERLVG